ncbi:adenosylcobinamide-GDP ribazoletransferase [Corynebacterium argentoratense]|uniref:adenosylcobinamide-GDP ribazoletransferase n=1 Tax=Corynebacterium argentoratense TaxID=42817 RepID=UPI001F271290|nr:adenosylcobinamide-GDP ribazoletransferase [Corynebacterium argentoratense]MCF1765061.1 adenosylcobinamide-GDP ribazoletransferase [Corynebacterium argentoratense]
MSGKAGHGHNSAAHSAAAPRPDEEPARAPALVEGVGTAISWLSIIPCRGARFFDRTTGRRAMAAMPVVGLILAAPTVALAALAATYPELRLLVAVAVVCTWQLLTRGMHVDGLADVGDALGSYAPPQRAQEILADSYTGALGAATMVLTLAVQTAAVYVLSGCSSTGVALITALPFGARIAATWGATRGHRPQKATGFGGLIVGTIARWIPLLWAAVATCALWATLLPIVGSMSPIVAVAALLGFALPAGVVWPLFDRRFGGLNGDCFGAVIELSTAAAATVLSVVCVVAGI